MSDGAASAVTPAAPGKDFWASAGHPLREWLLTTDHKRIGLLYLACILTMFAAGVVLGLLMRLELWAPGRTIMDAQTYNAVFTIV